MGCGSGWTTLFLAEAGFDALGYDLAPANVELARERAARWGSGARFEVADMDALPAGPPADAALIFDALHHTAAQQAALRGVHDRLKPGGWLLLGEPTWLHRLSPEARARAPRARLAGARPHAARAAARPARGGLRRDAALLPAHATLRGPRARLRLAAGATRRRRIWRSRRRRHLWVAARRPVYT